ncbi:MAG: hypothetical protein J6A07_04930 [Firmicutes bacterium]|nr:hypothetical protein [Bacillota bacterium]
MKSDVYKISQNMTDMEALLAESERCANYSGLSAKEGIRLRLLAEELVDMLPELLEYCSGEVWYECEGRNFEIHASVLLDDMLSVDREKLMSVSKSGKNAAAKGIMSKIRIAAETMFAEYLTMPPDAYYDFYSMGTVPEPYYYSTTWSLCQYKLAMEQEEKKDEESWDELEKSIIANLADDVVVGIKGRNVDIILKKSF